MRNSRVPNASALVRLPVSSCVSLYVFECRPRVGHAVLDGLQHLRGKRFRVECSVRADPELGEPGHDVRLGRIRRAEPEHEIEDVEKLGRGSLRLGAQRLDEVDRRRRGGRRLAEELRQRLDLVPSLDFLDVVDVVGTEKLRPVEDEGKFGLRTDHRLDARRRFAMPVRPGEQEIARVVARRPAADIGEVERVHVDELERVVTILARSPAR